MIFKFSPKTFASLFLAFALLVANAFVGATDVAQAPLIPSTQAKPNVIFGLDDSGSMDFEVMLGTNDGAFWWSDSQEVKGTTGAGWDAAGAPLYNATGQVGGGWSKYAYLFPNGCGDSLRTLCDSNNHYAIPPTAQFASLRSAAFNPVYYDSNTVYTAWPAANIGGLDKTFADSRYDSALSHPLYTDASNLTAEIVNSTASNTVFMMRRGMVVPAGALTYVNQKWRTVASEYTVGRGGEVYAAIRYFPATFWAPANCSVDNVACVKAPDGRVLKRFEIKAGVTFPSGRTLADELQNFANWYTFYRKRKFMLASSASLVMSSLTGMNLGVVEFNNRKTVTMYDTDSKNSNANAKVIIGRFYSNDASGGTPTRETLKYIGDQFTGNTNIVQYSCQKNAAFIMTDGFAYANKVIPPKYDATQYGATAPYTTTYEGSLADLALSYYTNEITRTGLAKGKVPATAPTAANPQNDGNSNLHVNTYAMTLGAKGTLWPAISNAYASKVTWPNPSVNASPTAVDDLWHATVNGRGQMFTAQTPLETAQSISAGLSNILSTSGAQSAVAFSTVNLRADEATAYVGSYSPIGWSGDIVAYPVDVATGAIKSATKLWSADALLLARAPATRAISTFNAGQGSSLGSATAWSSLTSAGKVPGTLTDFVNYVRGARDKEGTTYRTRTGMMGAVVNAEPVSWLVDKAIYATSNEGLLHAFDKTSGKELWAHAPSFVRAGMATRAKPDSKFVTLLDGTPTITSVSSSVTVLVGGMGTGGTGYYALNVINPRGTVSSAAEVEATDASTAQRALWEFPNSNTPPDTVKALGLSVGKPLVVKTGRWGWVALVSSGYNSTLDGKGRIFVLDATQGTLLATLTTTEGSVGANDAGLAQISAFKETDGTVQDVYAGDLLGNVWRFNLETSAVAKLATVANASNVRLPITAAPELAVFNSRRMVYVGTGQLLGPTDFSTTGVNTLFGLWDDGRAINPTYDVTKASTNVRNSLAPRVVTEGASGVRSVSGAVATGQPQAACTGKTRAWKNGACFTEPEVDWTSQRGFFVDFPSGEKANTDPTVGLGVLAWVTNNPSQTTCSSSSALYYADASSGLALPESFFPDKSISYGVNFASTLTSRPVITKLPSGRVAITTHQSNNTTDSRTLGNGGPETGGPTQFVKRAKVAWKQVLR